MDSPRAVTTELYILSRAYCARTAVAVDRLRRERCSILCRGGCFESCRGPSIFCSSSSRRMFSCPVFWKPTRPLPEEPRVDEIYRAMGTTGEQEKSPSGLKDVVCGDGRWWRGSGGFLFSPSGDQFQTDGSSHADRWYASSTKPLFRVLEGHERWSCRNALKVFVRGQGREM